jgi:hypothetical protein
VVYHAREMTLKGHREAGEGVETVAVAAVVGMETVRHSLQ